MADRLSRGQHRGKDDSRVRLACTLEVALKPAFVQWITKERAAPLLVGFRCGHPRNEALKVAPLERTERDRGGLLLHVYPIAPCTETWNTQADTQIIDQEITQNNSQSHTFCVTLLIIWHRTLLDICVGIHLSDRQTLLVSEAGVNLRRFEFSRSTTGASKKRVGRRGEGLVTGRVELGTDMPNTAQKVVPNNSQSDRQRVSLEIILRSPTRNHVRVTCNRCLPFGGLQIA
jgi:hypothetical protein